MVKRTLVEQTKNPTTKAGELPKVATGITGLDDVLHGGFPAGRTTLVSGGPGTGKSIIGMEFLYRGAVNGEPGIFVTFEEQAEAVRENALSLSWDLAPLEKEDKFFLFGAHVDPQAAISGDFNVKGLLAIVEGKAKSMGARRIVIDAVDVLMRLFDNPARERNELYALHDWLNDHEMTAVITVKTSAGGDTASRYEFLDYMADCVIQLDQRVAEQVPTRRMRVIKYRGSDYMHNECPFIIADNGINTIPASSFELQHKALGPKVSTGNPRLDAMLDGGYRRASCILLSGTAGIGKTTLTNTFVTAACERGEKVLYINFEESQEAMVSGMLSPGIDLRPALRDGKLRVMTALPEAMGAEEHLFQALRAVEAFQPDHVVVDAMSSCSRMSTKQGAYEYLMRLTNGCKEKGVTTILTNQTMGYRNEHEITGIDMSSMIDMVIFLRFIDIGGEVNRMLMVMKSRGQKASNQYREFLITDNGIDIMDVYVGGGGVLTGTARQEQEAREALEARRKRVEIELREHNIKQKRAEMEAEIARRRTELETAEAELKALQLEEGLVQEGRDIRGGIRGEDANSLRIKKRVQQPKERGTGRREGAK
jgi:circadian clock protein KaiC